MGLAKFENFLVLYFTKARLAQTLRICCHHDLRVSRNQPEAERFSATFVKSLNCAYMLWSFQNREMACKKKTRYTQEDLQFALRAVEGGKSLSAAAFFSCIALTYNCVTPSSSDVHFTLLTSKTVLANSLSPTKSPWFSSDSFVARVRDYQSL